MRPEAVSSGVGGMAGLAEPGWSELVGGDWEAARRRFEDSLAQSESAEAWEGLAWAAWWAHDGEGCIGARRRAYTLYRSGGDSRSAARQAIWLGCDHYDFRGEAAVASGWHQRAQRLLADVPLGPEHGWLTFQLGAYALELADDTTTARNRADELYGIARRLGSGDLEFLALGLGGLALVTEGSVGEGMARLDEVGVAATSGEIQDRIATSWMLCYLILACERVRDLDRASQWCATMRERSVQMAFDLGLGLCRAHYGGVLVFHGDWEQAEVELSAASELLSRTRPMWVAESWVRLAELRRRQGRAAEAAELFERCCPHPLANLGLAGLALDQGDARRAADLLDEVVATVPATSRTQRADALDLLCRACAALGDLDGARGAATGLAEIADAVPARPLRAMALVSRATVASAEGVDEDARRCLEEAVELFERSGLPYEADCTRMELAGVLARCDRTEAAARHARRAAERLSALGALYAAQRADEACRARAGATRSPVTGLSPRQMEVLSLLAEGCSDKDIARRLTISVHTAHRHVSNILAKLAVSRRSAAAALAGRHGLVPTEPVGPYTNR